MSNKTNKISKKKIIGIVLLAIVALGVAAGAWMLLSGRVAVMVKQPNERLALTYATVCDAEIVDRYNTASAFKQRGDADMPVQDIEAFQQLSKDITALDGYASDATCQTILFWTALAQSDHKVAQAAYEAIDELYAQNQFANSDLRNDMQLSAYPSLLQTIDPNVTETQESKGQGQ